MTLRLWRRAAAIGGFAGLVAAAWALTAAWSHNPNGELHGPAGIRWGELTVLAGAWFLVVAATVTVGARLVYYLLASDSRR